MTERDTTAQTNVMVTVRVLMRPPMAGERGWFVAERATPDEALGEVVRESEEFGWIADRDHPAHPSFGPDEEPMRAITVELERVE